MIRIGTSGYHFRDWVGNFYPDGLGSEEWLSYYSKKFSLVEINMSYYGLPKLESVQKWNNQTPDDFGFVVKVHGDTTHKRQTGGAEVAELLSAIKPLVESNKLLGLLAQFPASFHRTKENEDYLRTLSELELPSPLHIELRHASWDRDNTISFLRSLNLGYVAVDQPSLRSLSKARPAVTNTIGYVRFHGRNAATWYDPKQGDRYDWNYSDAELESWIQRVHALEKRSETTYLFFNNCHAGQAIKSALRMKKFLEDQFEVF